MNIRARGLACAAALALAPMSAPARADRGGEADRLFGEGVAYMKLDNCPDAIPKFLSSQQIERSAGTLVNLATCYARLGRTASAFRTYRDAQDAAGAEGNTELRDRAAMGMTRLGPTLTKLVLVLPRDATSLSLKLNGEQLSLSDSAPLPLDPGENIIEAAIPGRTPWRHRVAVTERGTTIVVEVPDWPTLATPEPPANWRPAAAIVGGIGLATLAAGSILAISAKVSSNASSRGCVDALHCNPDGNEYRQAALDKAAAASWMVATGALATAAGVGLWIASPAQRAPLVGFTPWMSAYGAGLNVSVRGGL